MIDKSAKGVLLAILDRGDSKYCLLKSSSTGEYHVAIISIYGEPNKKLCEPVIMTFEKASEVVLWANQSLAPNIQGFGNERALVQLAADRDKNIKTALIRAFK